MYYLIGIFIFYMVFVITGSRKQRMKIKIKRTITYKNVNVIPKTNDILKTNREEENETLKELTLESKNFVVRNLKIKSKNVDEEMTYLAVVPKSYTPEKSYPVLYLLHGLRDSANDWIEKAKLLDSFELLLEKKKIGKMIVILPNSGFCGESWYSDFKKVKNKNYESYFIGELMLDVKNRFNIDNAGIAGFSMGGYGAFKLGLKNLELFKVIGSFAGAVSLVRLTINKRITRIVKFIYLPNFLFRDEDKERFINIFGSWGKGIIQEDPYTLIKQLDTAKQQGKHFYLSVGSEDEEPYYMIHQWVDMVGRIKRFNLPFEAYIYKGETHTWDYIAKDIGRFLKYSWKYLK
ncbi:MAG: alpha/beta hydrolase-fold protein [Psychrilyobacter sp.]|uniref:alpha/beta hydrolase n=1 Tax=Psychrilyobacter sp. TaxID=2586924 RepID=UPI003C769010